MIYKNVLMFIIIQKFKCEFITEKSNDLLTLWTKSKNKNELILDIIFLKEYKIKYRIRYWRLAN